MKFGRLTREVQSRHKKYSEGGKESKWLRSIGHGIVKDLRLEIEWYKQVPTEGKDFSSEAGQMFQDTLLQVRESRGKADTTPGFLL